MTKKLYIGNLNYATTEEDLRQLFAGVGPVAAVNLVKDRMTGRAKGFGFVEMETEEGAQDAIARLNGTEFMNRSIRVDVAKPQADRPAGGGRRDGQRGGPRRSEGRDRNWDRNRGRDRD